MHFNGTLILLYFIEMLPRTVSIVSMECVESMQTLDKMFYREARSAPHSLKFTGFQSQLKA